MKAVPAIRSYVRRQGAHLFQVLKARSGGRGLSPVRFVIFGRGRSGSTALVSLLNSQRAIRCDGEILAQPLWFPLQHVLARCSNANARAYGCKILSYQVLRVQRLANRGQFLRQLHELGFKIIYLKRENLVQHAISNIRAQAYGYHKKTSDRSRPEPLQLKMDELMYWLQGGELLERFETEALQGLPHLPLTYERNLADESRQQATVGAVCDFLGLSPELAACDLRKVSPEKLRDSVANYEELAQRLTGTPYARFLD